jgi:hypothetical protein
VDARQLDAMPRAERRLRVREEALSLLREQGHMLAQSALAEARSVKNGPTRRSPK